MMGGEEVHDSPSLPANNTLKIDNKKKSKKSKKTKKANKTKRRLDQNDEKSHDLPKLSPTVKKQPKIENEEHLHHFKGVEPTQDTNLNTTESQADKTPGCGSSSWGDAFAFASSVEPLSLGDDFIRDEKVVSAVVPYGSGNINMVSQIANEYLEGLISTNAILKQATNDERISDNHKKSTRGIQDDKDVQDDKEYDIQKEEIDCKIGGDTTPCEPSPKKKRKKEKKKKKEIIASSPKKSSSDTTCTSVTNVLDSPPVNRFPFPTDPDDHCESPAVAYADIVPILEKLALMKNDKLRVYDPYYCDGSVISNLANLGFDNVYNKNEDCYKTWSKSETTQPYPAYDVLVTNPPYSADHVQQLMHHVTTDLPTAGKLESPAWCLLMPTYVHKKDYFQEMTRKGLCQPFYLVPKKRYVYIPPKNFRAKKESDVHKKSSPFVSMWYIWGGSIKKNKELMNTFKAQEGSSNCELARSKSALRDLRRK